MRWRTISGIAAVLLTLTMIFTLTYYLTGLLFNLIGWRPTPLVVQLINSTLGLLLVIGIAGTLGYLMRGRQLQGQMMVFQPILEAMERISKGDFSARVETHFGQHENNLISNLVDGVNSMAEELRKWEAMRQEFISNVSHEIQSPLTSIRGFTQALQSDDLTVEERQHYLSIIEHESTRLSRITENLLRLAALDSEHVKFDPQPYRLDKQLRNLILACEPQWTANGLDVGASLEEVEITADEDLLSQVWINLIANSIIFTPPGGRIAVTLCRRDSQAEFKIADTGIGITLADQERIFERFYKADRSRGPSKEGSGLGLSIAKKIVELHQGTICVDSQPGAGATFTVSLPLVAAALEGGAPASQR
jgi:signal transduction histidine kinase